MSANGPGGGCDTAFQRVREVFTELLATREIGAAVSVWADGREVADLWGGFADRKRTRAWEQDTLANVFSTTKGMTALCAHRLADRGELDLDAPVARYWPEFAAQGKEAIPVRQLLGHRAGLAAVRPLLPNEALYDWEAMTRALAAETPWWEPGTNHGYHAITFGWLVGELVRRISGKSLGRFFHDEIAGPLGLDFHIGLAPEHDARCASLSEIEEGEGAERVVAEVLSDPNGLVARAFANPPELVEASRARTRAWRAAEIPAANGHGTARALARVYGVLGSKRAGGESFLSSAQIERCCAVESDGPDLVLGVRTRFGLGFMLSQPDDPVGRIGPNPRAFGHPGMGGSIGFCDPDAGIGFGYVMNGLDRNILTSQRAAALIDAVYASL
jgi:CubicO group peptidase (beta-lactamase class C family)